MLHDQDLNFESNLFRRMSLDKGMWLLWRIRLFYLMTCSQNYLTHYPIFNVGWHDFNAYIYFKIFHIGPFIRLHLCVFFFFFWVRSILKYFYIWNLNHQSHWTDIQILCFCRLFSQVNIELFSPKKCINKKRWIKHSPDITSIENQISMWLTPIYPTWW